MDGNGVFIELIIFVLTIYGVLVMRKKVSSFIGNGDLLGTTNPLPKKWWTTTTSRGAASFFLRDEGFPDYTWSCYKCSTKWISTTRHILACSIILCHFFPRGASVYKYFLRVSKTLRCYCNDNVNDNCTCSIVYKYSLHLYYFKFPRNT